jgi:hypothetical protein
MRSHFLVGLLKGSGEWSDIEKLFGLYDVPLSSNRSNLETTQEVSRRIKHKLIACKIFKNSCKY